MSKICITEKTFHQEDFSIMSLPDVIYEACRFLHCNFNNADLSGINFTDCLFADCNLSSVKIIQTTFNAVTFEQCKMLGLHFENANAYLFTVHFAGCTLDLSSFYQRKMKKTVFSHCSLQEADFTETVLTEAVFDGCNLREAKFENTLLDKADLRTAINYAIDPEKSKVKQARFTALGMFSLLDKYQLRID